jgi:hypothetical protein
MNRISPGGANPLDWTTKESTRERFSFGKMYTLAARKRTAKAGFTVYKLVQQSWNFSLTGSLSDCGTLKEGRIARVRPRNSRHRRR